VAISLKYRKNFLLKSLWEKINLTRIRKKLEKVKVVMHRPLQKFKL